MRDNNFTIARSGQFKNSELKKFEETLVSVIIPTYNSALTIEQCINSLKEQTYDLYEILVVDNYSSDDTIHIAQRLGASTLKYRGGRTSARNYGAKKAAGKYLFNIDSDMELTSYVIEECVDKCENEGADVLIVPEISIGEGYLTKCKALEKQMLIGESSYEAARFLRKNIFDSINGYDESLECGEDFDIHYRLEEGGYYLSRINALIKHNERKLTVKILIEKNKYYSKTISSYAKKHKNRLNNQISVPQLYFKKLDILVKNPVLIPGLLFIKLIEFILIGLYARLELIK